MNFRHNEQLTNLTTFGTIFNCIYTDQKFNHNHKKINSNRVVPYLSRINSCEGTRKIPEILYVTRGEKQNSLIFHAKENGQFFQYRAKLVNKKSILLMCIYKRNIRSSNCHAFITVTPNRENLII